MSEGELTNQITCIQMYIIMGEDEFTNQITCNALQVKMTWPIKLHVMHYKWRWPDQSNYI